MLVNVLLVVGDDGLGDGLADGVDLRDVTTTGNADADVDTGELVEADNQKRLVDLYIFDDLSEKTASFSDRNEDDRRFPGIGDKRIRRTLKRRISG